jgi:hypothetical protein
MDTVLRNYTHDIINWPVCVVKNLYTYTYFKQLQQIVVHVYRKSSGSQNVTLSTCSCHNVTIEFLHHCGEGNIAFPTFIS